MEELLAYINSIYPLSVPLRDELLCLLREKTFLKKEYFLKAGKVCRNIYFIKEGLVRCFHEKEDIEVCSWFMKEGDLIVSVESFFKQSQSYENIQALEDCQVFGLEYPELQSLYTRFPEFNFIGRVLTEKYYILSEQRLFAMRLQRASDRFDFICDNHPEIVKRVPSKYIASYLGVTEETLSRIRRGKY